MLYVRHILANFHKKFKGECYIKPFWRIVKATALDKFELAMEKIKSLDVRMRCDAMENGVYESFNIQTTYHYARGHKGVCDGEIIHVEMERIGIGFGNLSNYQKNPYVSGYKQFEFVQSNERYGVDMEKRECVCRGWQLIGIPCVYVICAISSLNLDLEEYVIECFTKAAFLRSYEYIIHPVNDSSLWPHTPNVYQILHPIRSRLPARCPKRGLSEAGSSKPRKKSNAKNCPSQAGQNTPSLSTSIPMRQEPVTQEHVNQEPVSHVPVNHPVNQVPVNQVPMNQVLVNQVHVNLGVRAPNNLSVKVRKPLERIN
uniref:Zinc finger PMZ-type domain-containing protein n=1 Tax=Lactuca sativa TaxID=4236 RepID=A0A9R1WGC2_LACSA|nr:hypothetical protein LSAT_V11C100014620 [Lactuca sativa]